MPTNSNHNELLRLLRGAGVVLDKFYARQSRQLASVIARYRVRNTADIWKDNPALEREVDAILGTMRKEFAVLLRNQMQRGVRLSDIHADALVAQYAKSRGLSESDYLSQLSRSTAAAEAWIALRVKDFALSPRVWKIDTQTKAQLAELLKAGIAEGRDAASLAGDIKSYLRNPNRRFRRVRNAAGKLVLSEPAKNYKPGRGVYRSSYRNALRVTRNEINIAYRRNDYNRIQKMDFVKGIRVNLSPAHPVYDICDELQGEYPKKFKFYGWHPNCLCFVTTVLATREEFISSRRTGEKIKTRVKKIPQRAFNYLNENADTIKGWSSRPMFIQDNFKNSKNGFALKTFVTK